MSANNQTITNDSLLNIQIIQYGDNPAPGDPSNNDTNIEKIYEKFEFSGNLQVLTLNSDIRLIHFLIYCILLN